MQRIGLTGGIACGKSTASRVLASAGATILDADEIARDLVAPGSENLRRIAQRFGPKSLREDGRLDRLWLRSLVFAEPAARRWLEELLHPQIRAEFLRRTELLAAGPRAPNIVIWVVPLLAEGGYSALLDGVLLIDCSREAQWQRLRAAQWRDEDIAAVLACQADPARRRAIARWIIRNDGDEALFVTQVRAWWDDLQRSGRTPGGR